MLFFIPRVYPIYCFTLRGCREFAVNSVNTEETIYIIHYVLARSILCFLRGIKIQSNDGNKKALNLLLVLENPAIFKKHTIFW